MGEISIDVSAFVMDDDSWEFRGVIRGEASFGEMGVPGKDGRALDGPERASNEGLIITLNKEKRCSMF